MSKTRLIQIIVVALIAIITIVLYYLPISKKSDEKPPMVMQASAFSYDGYLKGLHEQLDSLNLAAIGKLESALSHNPDTNTFESLGMIYDELKQPAAAAYYFEKRAAIANNEKGFLEAAYRYFDAFKSAGDTSMRSAMIQHGIENYNAVIKINPENLDAKCDLGVLYTEGTGNPMQGILLLREVVQKNPNHVNAQLNLGMLSIKSGQYAKALERFDNVLKANPNRVDMYVYKAQAYIEMGDTTKSLENFQTFLNQSTDDTMKDQVKAYMEELKKGN